MMSTTPTAVHNGAGVSLRRHRPDAFSRPADRWNRDQSRAVVTQCFPPSAHPLVERTWA